MICEFFDALGRPIFEVWNLFYASLIFRHKTGRKFN